MTETRAPSSGHGSPEQRRQALVRLRSIVGHLRGIERMVEEGAYCIDIVRQTLAVQRALDRVNALLLEDHLQTCASRAMQSSDPAERRRTIQEIMDVFAYSGRR
ncbi:MAG: metal-sensitive transcriptional regulator [Armatimonadota bacterium]|nr:metal-sensitive transcriptional regulator [Armatimonadota bacterium]MDR7448873.1 metal-sensitive transcriptional regulator [Armatimonadota bacterium]MDR7460661.1 metal-sensitive transcriptional regulator [Armatimonadota bacterium]MDR7479246.1 metal-sensitive transcriptional regulator [Armatimonadota bacterium]MDR7487842.1 metal-sensitive transcriptional regulator [Armatimonadota bacterium]